MKQSEIVRALRSMGKKKRNPADNSVTLDKAAWHMETVTNSGLDPIQAYVPGSFLFGWLVDTKLVTDEVERTQSSILQKFRDREVTTAHLFQSFDGVLNTDLTNETGTRFLTWYNRAFLADYVDNLCMGLEGDRQYEVTDSWDNYAKLARIFDRRLVEFQNLR